VFICYVAAQIRELKQVQSQRAFAYAPPMFAGAT
jgi:hypothetical protein